MTLVWLLEAMFGWLPPWFVAFIFAFVALVAVLLIFKIVAFVLDVIPIL